MVVALKNKNVSVLDDDGRRNEVDDILWAWWIYGKVWGVRPEASDGKDRARDVPYNSEEAVEGPQDRRLAVVGFPTVEADIVRVDWDRWTLRRRGGLGGTGDEGGG